MSEIFGQILLLGVAVTLSPFPILAVVPIISSSQRVSRAWAFFAGWAMGLMLTGGLSIALFRAIEAGGDDSGTSLWVSIMRALLGVGMLGLAAKSWIKRPRPGAPYQQPGWMLRLADITIGRSIGLGALLSGANPKIILFSIGVGAAIAGAELALPLQLTGLIFYVVLGCIGTAIPVSLATFGGAASRDRIGQFGGWMEQNSSLIGALIFLLIGVKLIGDSIAYW